MNKKHKTHDCIKQMKQYKTNGIMAKNQAASEWADAPLAAAAAKASTQKVIPPS